MSGVAVPEDYEFIQGTSINERNVVDICCVDTELHGVNTAQKVCIRQFDYDSCAFQFIFKAVSFRRIYDSKNYTLLLVRWKSFAV